MKTVVACGFATSCLAMTAEQSGCHSTTQPRDPWTMHSVSLPACAYRADPLEKVRVHRTLWNFNSASRAMVNGVFCDPGNEDTTGWLVNCLSHP